MSMWKTPRATRSIGTFAFAALAQVLVGCSIHPLPEDVTRKTTYDIVRQARCEAQRALQLTEAQGLSGAIAYEFTFHITEINNASGDVTLTYPFLHGGQFSLMANAGLDRTRDANRNFKIVDSFADLRDKKKTACSQEALEKNWIYPMAGDIGIYEVVATFVRLQRLENLKAGQVFSFGDTLMFTTTFHGGVNPTLTLSPVTQRFRVTEASANLQGSRTDMHEVVLGLSGGPQTGARGLVTPNILSRSGVAAASVAPLASSSSVLSATLIQDANSAPGRALIELDRQRILALQARTPNLLVGP